MQSWQIIDGPAVIQHPSGGDWDIAWAWLIGRENERRHVVVYVAGGHLNSNEPAAESRAAVESLGKSAVADVLGEYDPPARLVVTNEGIRQD